MADIIKKIKAGEKEYDLDARYWSGHEFSEITNLVHGVVDTYVISAQTTGTSDYKAIVESSSAQVTTTASKLGALTGTPADSWDKFGVGDIVLMGATSDGKVNFDRWISSVDASGNIKLDILETQVATHHHTVNVPTIGRTITSSKALIGATPTNTTNNVARTGTAVTNVLTGTSGSVVTSVTHKSDGGYNLKLITGDSTSDYGHSHTVNSHLHTTTFKPNSLVSRNIHVYYSLASEMYTPHTHGSAQAAGIPNNSNTITYVTGLSASATFIKTLKDSSNTTNTGQNTTGTATGSNTIGLTTSDQKSTDTIGSDVFTLYDGIHTHSVGGATSDQAIKTLNIAGKVITSVSLSYTAPGVQTNVVTSVTKSTINALASAKLTGSVTFYNSMSVNSSGVLSFVPGTVGITTSSTTISGISAITTGTQSAGSASLSYTSSTQSYTSGTLGINFTTGSAGSHTHGFSHTHSIPSHTHTVAAHTHTYYKTVASETGNAIISLSTSTHATHGHATSVTVATSASNQASIKFVTGGSTASVVRDLKDADVSLNTNEKTPGTSTVYTKISGTITYPGLNIGYTNLATTSITPAVDTGETAIKSISYTSSNFLTGVSITSTNNTVNTSTNKGGNPS